MTAIRTLKSAYRALGGNLQEPTCDDLYAQRAERKNVKLAQATGAATLGVAGGVVGGVVGLVVASPELGAPLGAAGLGWLGGWVGKASAEDYNAQIDNLERNCPRRSK